MTWKDEDVVQEAWTDADIAAPVPKRPATSLASRVIEGMSDPIIGVAQIADKVLVNPIRQLVSPGASSMDDFVRNREAAYQAPEGIDVARMVGNVASPMNYIGGGSALPRALAARPVTAAATAGAAQAAMAPVEDPDAYWGKKLAQAMAGGAGGAVLSKTLRGFTPTPQAYKLMEQGVQPTFGQSMGGLANRIEQQATSIPLVGDAINYARNRAMKEFEGNVIHGITKGQATTLDDATALASGWYEQAVPFLKPTPQAVQNVQQAVRDAMQNPEMTDQARSTLAGLVQKHFQSFGQLDGPGIKNLDSELGYLARKYSATAEPASRTLAGEIYNVQGALRTGLEHGLPNEARDALHAANQTWRELIPVHKAASARADERILPRALQKAMARQQKVDVTRMRPDDLVDSAVSVLPNTVPDSGTAGRMMLGAGGLVGSGSVGLIPQFLGAGAVAGLGATRPVQRALVGNTAWQKALQPYDAYTAAALSAALRSKQDEQ